MLAICACGGQQKQNRETATSKEAKSEKKKPVANIISKQVHVISEFTHLTSVSGADIVFTPGDYSIEVTGDSALIQYLETDFDSNLLTISIASERNPEINVYEGKPNVTISISAPKLQCVSLCSSGNFTSKGSWKNQTLEFGTIGSGTFYCDSLECESFNYMSTSTGDANFNHIKAKKIHFANLNQSNVNATIDADILEAENKGNSTFTFRGKVNEKRFSPSKTGIIVFE